MIGANAPAGSDDRIGRITTVPSLLSMVLYQFYNADLLDIPKDEDEAAIAYVDDAILTATASTFQ